jgi:hypothetical protein
MTEMSDSTALVQASYRENGGFVRVRMSQRRKGRQRERAEAEFAVFPMGCRTSSAVFYFGSKKRVEWKDRS